MKASPYQHPQAWFTILIISGIDMDFDLVSSKLKIPPTATTKSGELRIPTLADGAFRLFDPRLAQDNWKKHLTGSQYKQPIEAQLQYWIDLLTPVRVGLDELKQMGYWSVLDCVGRERERHVGAVQFRLPQELRLRLAKLSIDIDFTISNISRIPGTLPL